MRMYGYLKTPRRMNRGDRVCKAMLHETRQEGTCAYPYDRPDALFSFSDLHYPTLEDAREDRDRGAPQWGQYKRLQDGAWKDFTP